MDRPQKLKSYIEAFEQLTPESLSKLGELFSEEVYFKDPFNAVNGKPATLAIFEHMFATTQNPKFIVIDAAMEGDMAMLYWKFHFQLPSKNSPNPKVKMIEGMSRVCFDKQGLVKEHIDYWDPAEQIYSQVPVLSWLLSLIRKRLSAST